MVTGLEIPIFCLSVDGVMLVVKKLRVRKTFDRSNLLRKAALQMIAEVETLVDDPALKQFHTHSTELRKLLDAFHLELNKGYLIPGKKLRDLAATCTVAAKNLEEEAVTLSSRALEDHLFGHTRLHPSTNNANGNSLNGNIVNNNGTIIGGNVVHNHNHYHVHQYVHVVPGAPAPSSPDALAVQQTVSNALSTELSQFSDVEETDTVPPPVDPSATTSYVAELVPPSGTVDGANIEAHTAATTVEISMEWWNRDNH